MGNYVLDKRNLLQETKRVLKKNGKTLKDIVFVRGNNFRIPVDTFLCLADTDYDAGFGGVEVATDLVIKGDDFVMVREEYDGSEWWRYISLAILDDVKDVKALTSRQASASREWFLVEQQEKHPEEDRWSYYSRDVMRNGTLEEYDIQARGADTK